MLDCTNSVIFWLANSNIICLDNGDKTIESLTDCLSHMSIRMVLSNDNIFHKTGLYATDSIIDPRSYPMDHVNVIGHHNSSVAFVYDF